MAGPAPHFAFKGLPAARGRARPRNRPGPGDVRMGCSKSIERLSRGKSFRGGVPAFRLPPGYSPPAQEESPGAEDGCDRQVLGRVRYAHEPLSELADLFWIPDEEYWRKIRGCPRPARGAGKTSGGRPGYFAGQDGPSWLDARSRPGCGQAVRAGGVPVT